MTNKNMQFKVTVKYSSENDDVICPKSMAENLEAAIENERQNNALTPDNISADWAVAIPITNEKLCGCGRRLRYSHGSTGVMSCNKYIVCPSYEELEQKVRALASKNNMKGYMLIEKEWENETDSKGTKYMQHIDMGIAWLMLQDGCSMSVLNAWCVHPIVQDISGLEKNFSKLSLIDTEAAVLAVEYRNQANHYSTHNMDKSKPRKRFLPEIRLMLIADKLQNSWNLTENRADHENYEDLLEYFSVWFEVLGVNEEEKLKAYKMFNEMNN